MMRKNIQRPFFLLLVLGLMIYPQPMTSQSVGRSGMVVSAHAQASQFGVEILQFGGNAIDAAVGAALMLGAVEPYGSGLGGGGAMLIYLHELDSLTYINYYACAPESLPTQFNAKTDADNARSVLVPGTVAGLHYALKKYGTLGWSELLQKVVRTISNGILVDETLHRAIIDSYEKLLQYPEAKAIYLRDDMPPEPGSKLSNRALLTTLSQLAELGADGFYRGPIADSIQAAMVKYGGYLRKADLEKYQVRELIPLTGSYRGFTVVTAPPPQSGMSIIEALNILELQDLKAMGGYTESPRTFHFMAEVLRRVYSDRSRYLGDPLFDDIPIDVIVSKGFAQSRFQSIDLRKVRPFRPDSMEITNRSATQKKPPQPDGSTTHLSVVDRHGNAVSLTQTLNHFWGSGMTVCGFLLNNGMTSFSGESEETPNRICPGKQPRTTISPTMLFQNGQLMMVIGSPGAGRIISTLVQVICNVVDFGMTADVANRAPRFYSRGWKEKLPIEDRFSPTLLAALESMGYSFQKMGEFDHFFGGVQFIMMDHQNQLLIGSSDPRRYGQAAGY